MGHSVYLVFSFCYKKRALYIFKRAKMSHLLHQKRKKKPNFYELTQVFVVYCLYSLNSSKEK